MAGNRTYFCIHDVYGPRLKGDRGVERYRWENEPTLTSPHRPCALRLVRLDVRLAHGIIKVSVCGWG